MGRQFAHHAHAKRFRLRGNHDQRHIDRVVPAKLRAARHPPASLRHKRDRTIRLDRRNSVPARHPFQIRAVNRRRRLHPGRRRQPVHHFKIHPGPHSARRLRRRQRRPAHLEHKRVQARRTRHQSRHHDRVAREQLGARRERRHLRHHIGRRHQQKRRRLPDARRVDVARTQRIDRRGHRLIDGRGQRKNVGAGRARRV